ncbi:MAG TPA: hypothetical protein VLA36_03495 [Longimicrobiales bacterium]|nr:hypothetical protein [Longimicrobiales bacterium]
MSQDKRGVHLATLAHQGRLWDAYVEFDDDPHHPESHRARLRFDSPEVAGSFRTTLIFIEPSHEEVVHRARGLEPRQLEGLLRSVLPTASPAEDSPAVEDATADPGQS